MLNTTNIAKDSKIQMVPTMELLLKVNSRWEMLALIKTLIEFKGRILNEGRTKNPIKTNGWNHHMEDIREGQKKAKKTRMNQRRERASPSRGRKLSTHSPSNVACMQIMTPNSNKRFRTSISCQRNLPFYSKG